MRVTRANCVANTGIARDYYQCFHRLSDRFPVPPRDYLRHSEKISNYCGQRQILSDCLVTYNRQLGAGGKALTNARLLARDDCLVVVTGQQTGFFTGPALTVYKAMTAITMAGKLRKELSRPVVPVFWMAGEDHDYAEVNRLFIISAKKRKKLLISRQKPVGRPSVGCSTFFKKGDFFPRLAASLPETEFNRKLLAEARGMADTAENLCQWFARLMLRFLGDYGLVMLDPMLPNLRRLARPVFERAISESAAVQEEVSRGERELKYLGYAAPISKEPGYMHLFYYHEGNRVPLYLRQNRVSTRKSLTGWETSLKELKRVCERSPENFSPGVALRPVLQDFLLPTVLFVAGPGEINYLAQLKELYQGFGVSMPPVYPRAQVTVVGKEEERILQQLRTDEKWLTAGFGKYVDSYLRRRDPVNISELMAEKKEMIHNYYRQLVEDFCKLDSNFLSLGEKNWTKLESHLNYLEKIAWQSVRKKNKQFFQQVIRVEDILLPGGSSQEQIYSFYSLLFYFGEELLAVLDKIDFSDVWSHQIVYLNG